MGIETILTNSIKKEFAFMSLEDIKNKIDEYNKNSLKKVQIFNFTSITFDIYITKEKDNQSANIYIYDTGKKESYHKFDKDTVTVFGMDKGALLDLDIKPDIHPDKKAINHMKRNNN